MSHRSEMFGRLLRGAINSIATYEGKTAPLVEEELGAQIGLAGSAIQRYKAGHLPPEPRTIQVFAEAAVRRGYLGREWLRRFLQTARYPDSERLIEQLAPPTPDRPRPPRSYHNLPAPTYSQFVMRPEPFAEIADGLGKRSSAVLIIGLGGSGKTSLAREVAGRCLQGEGVPLFDAVVWVSDKDRPGTTNLSMLLDEVARTLDYPGFAEFAHDEKRYEVEQLLRRQRVLIIVDNFETITDGALLTWLLDLPEPSKALITARTYLRAFRRGGWPVELRGMSDTEAQALIEERLKLLRMDRMVSEPGQIEPLIAVTGGNPKAIELALGIVKYERRPLRQVVDDLHAARGDLFEDLFTNAWSLLDEAARRVLLVLTFFPVGASAEALGKAADIQHVILDRALERLADLALLDIQQENLDSAPRYLLHPLARAFAAARLRERPELEREGRERWLGWCLQLASAIETHWYDTRALAAIDADIEAMAAVAVWAEQQGRDSNVLTISRTLGYYYYVRGWWSEQLQVNQTRLAAARRLRDRLEEGYTLVNILRLFSLQGRYTEARPLAVAVEAMMHEVARDDIQRSSFLHSLAVFALASGDRVHGRAMLAEVSQRTAGQDLYKYVRAQNWIADSMLEEGRLEEAETLLKESLPEAQRINYNRAATFAQLRLAQIALRRNELHQAELLLKACLEQARLAQDRRDLALILKTYAQLSIARGDLAAAQAAREEAADLFERLGMRQEFEALQTELM